jgi:hypothetical protein
MSKDVFSFRLPTYETKLAKKKVNLTKAFEAVVTRLAKASPFCPACGTKIKPTKGGN